MQHPKIKYHSSASNGGKPKPNSAKPHSELFGERASTAYVTREQIANSRQRDLKKRKSAFKSVVDPYTGVAGNSMLAG